MEVAPESSQQYRKQNVCDECHDGDVHVRRIEIVSRGQEHGRILLLDNLTVWSRRVASHSSLLAGPGLVSPWEEDESEFPQDIGVGDVEVVLQCGNGDVAVELELVLARMSKLTLSTSLVHTFCSMYS